MPNWEYEDQHQGLIVGIDEAGRGPWAGPVTAGAVIFLTREVDSVLLTGLNDSKQLSARQREDLFKRLCAEKECGHVDFELGWASAAEIDQINILQATFLAMRRAVEALEHKPDVALIDGNRMPKSFICPVQTIIKGDALSFSVAAASIVAKVSRDRFMKKLAETYPFYGFEQNAGYGTKQHRNGILEHGLMPEHRRSYRPIANYILESRLK